MGVAYETCLNLFSTETHFSGKNSFELVWDRFPVGKELIRVGDSSCQFEYSSLLFHVMNLISILYASFIPV